MWDADRGETFLFLDCFVLAAFPCVVGRQFDGITRNWMTKSCPHTHYDLVASYRPEFFRTVQRNSLSYCSDDVTNDCLLNEETDIDRFEDALRSETARYGRENFDKQGISTHSLGDDEIIATIPSKIRNRYIDTLSFEYLHLIRFEKFGRKTFYFDDNLVQRLADTEMNVDVDLLRLPFPSCLFVFDGQSVRDSMHAISGTDPRNEGTISVYLNMLTSRETGRRTLEIAAMHTHGHRNFAVVKRELDVESGQTLEEALRTEWGNSEEALSVGDYLPDSAFYGPGLKFIRTVVNSALYLASSNPDIIPGLRDSATRAGMASHEIRRLDKQLRHATKLNYISIGSRSSFYDAEFEIGQKQKGNKLEERIKVRGHWKTQAHGPGRQLKKIIHVEPYWRGPDMAEAVSKPYFAR